VEFSGPERTSRYTSGTVGPSANDESPRSDRAIRAALVSREGAAALFEDLAAKAKPWNGAAQLLRVVGDLGDMAVRGEAPWATADLLVEIRPATLARGVAGVDLSISALDAVYSFEIPFDELRWFIERVPELAGPLVVRASLAGITMEGRSFDDIPVDLDSTAERPAVTEQMLDAMRPQFMTPVYIPPDELLDKSR